jgi:hypothetical protein
MFDHLHSFVTFAVSNNRICKTLKISLPTLLTESFHSLMAIEGGVGEANPQKNPYYILMII